eukprot:Gregarina_sp_Pseudo_9__705@NODE_144_length_3963_cov_52_945973_g132_i0_p1_GENE_NODE_144_length_3963_cov_52_945973_g132_i0NODE_144_length_3963_cov_52_945973_g132_i0_p1_ORF_typecomplete_len789_score188_60DUF1298/PF06974_13/6_7e03DUF1298/PF06974_13/6e15WES_acyltransf/PF03007_16/2_2e03WES_acyltransf/PF03007_16/1_2e11AATase/PF07247_12/0_0013AATase/PF07247_12/1e02Condensation/PF00668_20/0_029DUF3307/PF11750_8/0_15DUF3307/PF11750_8/1_1e04_NODE_144_length_3963_cov_52_945973_g132_i01742540
MLCDKGLRSTVSSECASTISRESSRSRRPLHPEHWLRHWESTVPQTLRQPPRLFLPYTSFPLGRLRRAVEPLFGYLSECWQSVWDGRFAWPLHAAHRPSLLRRLRALPVSTVLLGIGMLNLWIGLHVTSFVLTLCVCSMVSGLWLWDLAGQANFWVHSMSESFTRFNEDVCRSLKALPETRDSWTYGSRVLDQLFDWFVLFLENCQRWSPRASIPWRYYDTHLMCRDFRRYLCLNPPPCPVASYDYPFLQDSNVNPSQIVALAITERITLDALRQLTFNRWVVSEFKLRSVLDVKWNRVCWVPLSLRPSQAHTFSISNHVDEELLDLSVTSIYEAVSEIASNRLPRSQPLWRVVLFQPCNGVVQVAPNLELPANEVSFVCVQIHHAIADGTGIAYSICSKLFDSLVSDGAPVLKARLDRSTSTSSAMSEAPLVAASKEFVKPSAAQLFFYYAFYFLKALWYALGTVVFWFLVAPLPSAVMDPELPGEKIARLRNDPTGRKYLLPPEIVSEERVRNICNKIYELQGQKPTINDVYMYCIARVLLPTQRPFTNDNLAPVSDPNYEQLVRLELAKYGNLYVHKFASRWADYLQCMIPMSARTSFPTCMDNFTSFVLTRLPGDVLANPANTCASRPEETARRLRHLFAVKGEMDWLKQVNGRTMFFMAACTLFRVFPDAFTRWIGSRMNNACRICFTNVVGPSQVGSLGGKKVHGVQSWPPVRDSLTTGIKLLSYRNQLQLLILMDEVEVAVPARLKGDPAPYRRKMFRNAQSLGKNVMKELFALENLLGLS